MHVGLSLSFHTRGGTFSDAEVWANAVRSTELAVELGFDGVWVTEHHFGDYEVSPDPLQFLSYVAGRFDKITVGTMAVILPWHDPIRVAEQISVLDTLSDGRLVLAVGRGLGKSEFDGFGIPMGESRGRFVEAAEMVLTSLETGVMSSDGPHYKQIPVEVRPKPTRSFRDRSYAAAMSPESFDFLARLGLGALVIAFKSWDGVGQDLAGYRETYAEVNDGAAPPPPLANALVICHEDHDTAEAMAQKYISNYYNDVISHYGFNKKSNFAGVKGYEHYAAVSEEMDTVEAEQQAVQDFIDVQVWGTPQECLEKIEAIREKTGCGFFLPTFASGGVPMEEVEHSMRLFARDIMPALQAHEPQAVAG